MTLGYTLAACSAGGVTGASSLTTVTPTASTEEIAEKAVLKSTIAAGEAVYADTLGKVQDDSLRVELRSRLDAGLSSLADDSAALDALSTAQRAIDEQRQVVLAARSAQWSDANGVWCHWKFSSTCDTIEYPNIDGELAEWSAAPFSYGGCLSALSIVPSDPNAAIVVYCPKGISARSASANFENLNHDRLYVTLKDANDPYFRQGDLAAAVAGG